MRLCSRLAPLLLAFGLGFANGLPPDGTCESSFSDGAAAVESVCSAVPFALGLAFAGTAFEPSFSAGAAAGAFSFGIAFAGTAFAPSFTAVAFLAAGAFVVSAFPAALSTRAACGIRMPSEATAGVAFAAVAFATLVPGAFAVFSVLTASQMGDYY